MFPGLVGKYNREQLYCRISFWGEESVLKLDCDDKCQFSSVAQSCLTLRPHLQHVSLPCPSPTPGAFSNSSPSNWWCHPTTSSSVIPFSSCPQSFPISGSVPMSQFFASGEQNIGASAPASVLPMSIQDWFPLGLPGLISLKYKGLSRVFFNTSVQKHQFFGTQFSLQSNSHPYMTTGKTIGLIRWTLVGKVMSLLFNMLSKYFVTSFPKSKHLLI